MPRLSAPLTLEYILLGILDQRPLHGYDLYRELNAIDGIRLIWNLKQSMLYALLEKLEAEGLLEGQLITGEARPSRREYHLTSRGKAAFQSWMQSPVKHGREMRQDFLARLYFALRVGSAAALALIEQQRQLCLLWQQDLQTHSQASTAATHYDHFVFSFRLSQVQSMLDWLESCSRELARPNDPS
jgi:PadR family transcriptional regulator, regulatory protein AphA